MCGYRYMHGHVGVCLWDADFLLGNPSSPNPNPNPSIIPQLSIQITESPTIG